MKRERGSADLAGRRFGRLTVLRMMRLQPKDRARCGTVWECLCQCGRKSRVRSYSLIRGHTKSCGCLRKGGNHRRHFIRIKRGAKFGRLTVQCEVRRPEGLITKQAFWRCRCKCGKVVVVRSFLLRYGYTRSCGCLRLIKLAKWRRTHMGAKHPAWKGGRRRMPEGYIRLRLPYHPNAGTSGYVLEHTKVMSDMLGRPLRPGELVHHKNGVRDDNRRSNLELRVWSHPPGVSIRDAVLWARKILKRYDRKQ